MRAAALLVLLCIAAVTVPALRARADAEPPPRGPAFGNTRYRTEIGPRPGDADAYVSSLIRGEALSVVVAPARGSRLRPELTITDPEGRDRTADAAPGTTRAGAVSVRAFVVDRTGPWAVRVSGAGRSTGAYAVRFAVRPAPPVTFARRALGGTTLEAEHTFDAVAGAAATAVVTSARPGRPPAIAAVTAPGGAPLEVPPPTRGRRVTSAHVPLGRGDGAYGVVVGIDEGEAAYVLRVAVRPPWRPRGTIDLPAEEPELLPGTLRGGAGAVARLHGAHFSTGFAPEVWFGARPALVLGVDPDGRAIDVVPPAADDGTVADVAVVNPDGQAVVEPDYFTYATPSPPVPAALTPALASVYAGGRLRYWLSLSKPAPAGGVSVTLAADGGVGGVPATVVVPQGTAVATFELVAGPSAATGGVRATYGGATASAAVRVVPVEDTGGGADDDEPPPPLPDEIDLSGWSLVQANSARTYVLPPGTRLRQGEYVVVGRAAPRAAFEAYWGVELGPEVRYVCADPTNTSTSTDDWPSMNGDETFELRNPQGVRIDGPTCAMQAGGGGRYERIPGTPAGPASSWTYSTPVPRSGPSPGGGQPSDAGEHGVYVSEFCDAFGSGNYVYEFVELFFSGHP